jgi:hypothetical protein
MLERVPNENKDRIHPTLRPSLSVEREGESIPSLAYIYIRACVRVRVYNTMAPPATATEKSNGGGSDASTLSTTALANRCLQGAAGLGLLVFLYYILVEAYEIRLYAIKEYGRVIHEFDPYFNYRATEVR